jgi:Flp pilus assembly pilin Flp
MRNYLSVCHHTKTRIDSPSLVKNQRGSAAVDYAIILVFVVLVVVAAIVALQDRSNLIFKATTEVIGDFGRIQ